MNAELFNTDSNALECRSQANASWAENDLDAWSASHISLFPGAYLLDLGCGNGKQIFRFGRTIGKAGSIVVVDSSTDALATIQEKARREGLEVGIRVVHCDLDECPDVLCGETFDRIVSTYAIYYSRDMVALLSRLRNRLRENGIVFLAGYGQGSNQELGDLMACESAGEGRSDAYATGDFIGPDALTALKRCYRLVETYRLPNRILFPNAQTFLSWWRNHNSYTPSAEDCVVDALTAHFEKHASFGLTKNVLGVKLAGPVRDAGE